DSCEVPKDMRALISTCHDEFSSKEQDKTPLSLPRWKPVPPNTAYHNLSRLCPRPWRYNTAEQLGFHDSWGFFHMYDGGGYVADLGYNNETKSSVVFSLRLNHWMDRRTRVVLLEFAMFNPATNYLSVVTYYYE
ncbi:predicted protein, partial [Nematostella vectensis]